MNSRKATGRQNSRTVATRCMPNGQRPCNEIEEFYSENMMVFTASVRPRSFQRGLSSLCRDSGAACQGWKYLLRMALAKLGYRVQGTRYCPRQLLEPALLRRLEFDDVVCRRMFEVGPQLTFVQVGAFDGVTGDPLRKYIEKCGWRGVVVEPQAQAVDQLRELYRGNDRIVILQAALDRRMREPNPLHRRVRHSPRWAGGLASFQRENIVKHSDLIPGWRQ